MYEYNARCIRVVDGDTYDFEVDLGFNIRHTIRVRLAFCDTPELRAATAAEKEHARSAKKFCHLALLADPERPTKRVRIRTMKDKKGKYGRYIAEVWLLKDETDDAGIELVAESLGDLLAEKGLLKRAAYPSDAERHADELFRRQEDQYVMAEKRALEGVMTVQDKTPTD